MNIVQCNNCEQKVEVAFYFYGEDIAVFDSPHYSSREYTAMVNGRAICPMCGKAINKIFHKTIGKEDIIKIALGE